MSIWKAAARASTAALTAVLATLACASPAGAVPPLALDPFYTYDGPTPLAKVAPGTVLDVRTVPFHLASVPLPLEAVQLLYRSTGQRGQPTVNVTSVVNAVPGALRSPARKVVSYQSFYDSLNPADQPSFAIAGGLTFGGLVNSVEVALIAPFLTRGYSVVIPDTEGQEANFAAGPEYGMNTLDGLRAALMAPEAKLARDARIGMVGYSGGAIATEWAAELAPSYAPDVDARLIGSAMGGVLVHPAHNLHYVSGSQVWAGVMPMAIAGVARSFDIDLTPYLSEYGLRVFTNMQDASIAEVLGAYPGLTWEDIAKPEWETPEEIPIYVRVVNELIMGTGGTPSSPLFIGQGAKGEIEGTKGDKPGIGPGDGVMIAGDVRSLARQYCDAGVAVQYDQYDKLSHVGSTEPWTPAAITWLEARFRGEPAPENCAEIAPGNPLDPIPMVDEPTPTRETSADTTPTPAAAAASGASDEPTAASTAAAAAKPKAATPTCLGKRATIVGTAGADVITGTRRADIIVAGGGADTVSGGGGNDLICGGAGNDRLSGGTGDDRLSGGTGADHLLGGAGRDLLSAGAGRDRCTGGPGRDRASGCERLGLG